LLQLGNLKNVRPQLKLNIVLKVQVKNKKLNKNSSARTFAEKRFEADCSNVQPQLQQYLCWAFAFLSVKVYELFLQTISKLLKILKHFFEVCESKVFVNKSQLSTRKSLQNKRLKNQFQQKSMSKD